MEGKGWEGRGGEWREREGGREGGRKGGREGGGGREGSERRDECYTYANGPQYLNSSYDVTYYVITCKSAFYWVYAEQWYVIITFDVTWNPGRAIKLLEAGCTNKLSIPV